MLLLHISDIHFRHPDCHGSLDPELPYREHLIRHAAERAGDLGDVQAILVTGDIAFCGIEEEYDAARAWLDRLAQKAGCKPGRIYVVPGNHDVNRAVFIAERVVKSTVGAIHAEAGDREREKALCDTLRDPASSELLFRPIEAYNAFAAGYDCQVSPDRPFWTDVIPISDKAALSLRGMTSTFLSGLNWDDVKGDLYLGAMQAGLPPQDGVVHLVLVHHPPSWMSDSKEVNRRLLGEPAIVLFGHEHERWLTRDVDGPMLVRAGSVNPERYGSGWDPAYNLMHLSVGETTGGRFVKIRTWQYHWQDGPNMFVAVQSRIGNDYSDHVIALHGDWTPPEKPTAAAPVPTDEGGDAEPAAEENPLSGPDTRSLIYRFWKLRRTKRRQVMIALGAIGVDEAIANEPTRYRAAMVAIARDGRIAELEAAIEAHEQKG